MFMLKQLRIALWALVAIAAVSAVAYVYLDRQNAVATTPAIGGPFKLAASSGDVVDSEKLKGQPFAVFFGFTHCPDVCPTTLYEMSSALGKLGTKRRISRCSSSPWIPSATRRNSSRLI